MTQYERILSMLRKAGRKGCTVRDLLQCTNYPSARIYELEGMELPGFSTDKKIDRTWREVNGRRLRVYVLRMV